MRLFFVTAILAMATTASVADMKKAQSCANGLSPESKLIFDASATEVTPDSDIKSIVESKTRSLVIDGKIERSGARAAAEAAGACLRLVKA